jgi:hypothetical protein
LRGVLFPLLLICHFLSGVALSAQQQPPGAIAASHSSSEYLSAIEKHRFFDRENLWLFAGVGASRSLDYSSTLNMRRRGRQEILLSNWIVDRHALFAGIEAGGTALSIGASYWLHRTGHHQLERWFSLVHIGAATTGAVRNYSLQTAHPDTQ